MFNLRFKTLSGQMYRLVVKSTDSIETIKAKLMPKILEKNPEFAPSRTTIRLFYVSDDAVELMDNMTISEYPDVATLKTEIAITIETEVLFDIHAMAPAGAVNIRVKPSDTIFEVKKKINQKFLEDPFYKTYGSAMFTLKYNGRPMLDNELTLSRYPMIQKDSVLEVDMDDSQYYLNILYHTGKYVVSTLQERVPFNLLMTGSELKHVLTSSNIEQSKDYVLHIGRKDGEMIEDDAYLFEYPDMDNYEKGLYLSYVNNNNSNSNTTHNSNKLYNSNYSNFGGKRVIGKRVTTHKSRRTRKTLRKSRRTRK